MSEYKMNQLKNYYEPLYEKFGVNERSLGWTKNKQAIRFEQLLSYFNVGEGNRCYSLLDVGCGFADLNGYIKQNQDKYRNLSYNGIDMMPNFIEVAKSIYPEDKDNIVYSDFMKQDFGDITYDIIVGSGTFGVMVSDDEDIMYDYVSGLMGKAFDISNIGISFNFMSNNVDVKGSKIGFYSDPCRILKIAFGLSKRVVLDNSIMPFEYCVTIWKDDSFAKETTVFNNY